MRFREVKRILRRWRAGYNCKFYVLFRSVGEPADVVMCVETKNHIRKSHKTECKKRGQEDLGSTAGRLAFRLL